MTYVLLKNSHSENGGERVLTLNSGQATACAEEIESRGQPNRRRLHTEILYEDFLEETRTAFANVVSAMNHRSESIPDAFVRHHLVAVTREVAEIGRVLLAKASVRPHTQNLVEAFDREIADLSRSFPNRLRRTGASGLSSKTVAPWTIVQVFRLLVNDFLKSILQNVSQATELHASLQKTGTMLRLDIKNINIRNETHLLGCLKSRFQFRQRLDALGGRVEADDQAISILIPNAVFLGSAFLQSTRENLM
jgi:hypothetical protein